MSISLTAFETPLFVVPPSFHSTAYTKPFPLDDGHLASVIPTVTVIVIMVALTDLARRVGVLYLATVDWVSASLFGRGVSSCIVLEQRITSIHFILCTTWSVD